LRSIIVIFVLVFVTLSLLLGFSESFHSDPENTKDAAVADIEGRIDEYIAAMQATSEMPQVKNTDYLSSINAAQMGIPEDADIEKRAIARQLLSEHQEFASIFFLTPSGDLYLGEPFEQQRQLPRLNYADRDWYQGVSSTSDAYVSLVFMSAAIHVPAVAVAVPVFIGDQVAGYWVAIVNLGDFGSSLGEFGGASRVLLVDHNGTEVADTARTGQLAELRSFASLQSVQKALSGDAGTLIEQVDGIDMNARFAPVKAHPNTWAIVFLDPTV
jgi:cache domain-containing protein